MGNLVKVTPFSEMAATIEVFDRLGVTREDLHEFRKAPRSQQLKVANLLRSASSVGPVVDLDANPFIPEGWVVESHDRGAPDFVFDISFVELYLDESQEGKDKITGDELLKRLDAQSVFNANMLDFLLDNQDLIPQAWRGKAVFFWGTIYRDAEGKLGVRYMSNPFGRWLDGVQWLHNCFPNTYLALLAS